MKHPNEWLYFTKSERRGIFILLLVLLIITFIPKLYPYFIPQEDHTELLQTKLIKFKEEQRVADSIDVEAKKKPKYNKKTSQSNTTYKSNSIKKNASNNYIPNKIETQKVTQEPTTQTVKKVEKKPVVININTATASDFAKLSGIGEVFSNRIIKYRNGLGGFVSVEQVGTTFGIEPETFSKIKSQLVISTDYKPKQLNINTATVDQLKNHTYISEKLASQMVNYREKVAPFQSDEDIKKLYLMNDNLFQKLKPYLTY